MYTAFIQAILDTPDDDAVRLIFADWLEERGDPRGEFIRVQVELARAPADDPRVPAWKERERELLAANWEAWVGPLRELLKDDVVSVREGWLRGGFSREGLAQFRRGFIETLTLQARVFVERAGPLLQLAPVRHLRLWYAGEVAPLLARCPHLAGISTLEFVDYFRWPLDAAGMRALAESPYLWRLRQLNLYRNNLGDAGMEALASAPWLRNVRMLNVMDNGLSERGVHALAVSTCLEYLHSLHLGSNDVGNWGTLVLMASPKLKGLRTLGLSSSRIGPHALASLSHSFSYLWTLDLDHNALGPEGARILARSKSLRSLQSLNLCNCQLGDEGVSALVRWPLLAGVRSLALNYNGITDRGVAALTSCPGLANLTALGLEGNEISRAGEEDLRTSPYLRQLESLNLYRNPLSAF